MNYKTLLPSFTALALGLFSSINYAQEAPTTQPSQSQAKPLAPPAQPSLDKMHLNNSNAYALDMLRNFNQDANDKNLVFSPTSLQFMLAMLGNAADNKTATQLNQAWHEPSSITIEQINEQLALRLKLIEHPADLILANGVFINKKYNINPDYQTVLNNYKAEITTVDFTKKSTVHLINNWVKKHTKGQIPKIIDSIQNPQTTQMVLTNAIAFEGKWPEKYFDVKYIKRMPFTGIKGKKYVYTMRQNKLEHYYEDDNLQAIYLPYEGHQYALFILLPKSTDKTALDSLLNKLDIVYFNNISNGFFNPPADTKYAGTLYLPRFKISYDNPNLVDKSETLLGVNLNYNAQTNTGATFDKALLLNDTTQHLTLTKMVHKAIIEVNEKGTKAAAATHAELGVTSISPIQQKTINFTMQVNHPFIYGIIDKQQQLLFLGTVKTLP